MGRAVISQRNIFRSCFSFQRCFNLRGALKLVPKPGCATRLSSQHATRKNQNLQTSVFLLGDSCANSGFVTTRTPCRGIHGLLAR